MLRVRLDLLTDGGPPPAIACLALDNFEDLARHHGAAAARLAAASMQQAVAGARLRDEVVGRTVAGSLAVVLPFDGKVDRLWQRARALAEAAEVTASWHGHDLRVHVRLGVHVCAKGKVPAEVLDQAAATARRVV
jgi:GGDEF domain-containing protein